MMYYRIAYTFLVLGCWYFFVMGLRQTMEIYQVLAIWVAQWRHGRELKKIAAAQDQAKASKTPYRPPVAMREKLFPRK
jgi:hypothetical protein